GNFTISRYSALTLSESAVDVLYIIDMAEIPTFQERQAMDSDGDGAISPVEETVWLNGTVADLAGNLRLSAGGDSLPLTPTGHAPSFPPGEGELETLRLEITLPAPSAQPTGGQALALSYEDANYPDGLGWQEVVGTAAAGSLLHSTVPASGLSDGLTSYP